MRFAHGFGAAFLPAALIIRLCLIVFGDVSFFSVLIVGGLAALVLEPWEAIAGEFRIFGINNGLLVYGKQVAGGMSARVVVAIIRGLIAQAL